MTRFALLALPLLAACAASQPLPRGVTAQPNPLDFGKVFVGDPKDSNVSVTNGRAAAVPVTGAAVLAGTVFTAGGAGTPALPANLAANASLSFPIRFTPPAVGAHAGTWHVTVNGRTHAVALRGEGVLKFVDPVINVSHGSDADGLDFGLVVVNTGVDLKHQVSPGAGAPLLAMPTVTGAGFRLKHPRAGDNLQLGLPPGVLRIKVEIEFRPTQVGLHTGLLTITDATGRVLAKTFLQGVGVLPPGQDAPNDQ
jgi:hypothetical protein